MDLGKRCTAEFIGTFWLVFGGWALMQLWLFWIAPVAGADIAGIVHRQVFSVPDAK